jgi:hypothetical protein
MATTKSTKSDRALVRLEKRLELPEGFIQRLQRERNDFAFIVKLAVLAEATVTTVIVAHLHNEKLYDHISQLQQGRRLDLAEKLGLLERGDRLVLETLSNTRNAFAHRVKNLTATLDGWFTALPGGDKAQALNRLMYVSGNSPDKFQPDDGLVLPPRYLRGLLFRSTMFPLISLSTQDQKAQREKERRTWLDAAPPPAGYNALMNLGFGPQHPQYLNALAGPGLLSTPLPLAAAAAAKASRKPA